jgi:uncharacterized protein YdeI (YjbR/CyaY-like superfamily)
VVCSVTTIISRRRKMKNDKNSVQPSENKKNPVVDAYIANAKQWRLEFTRLREIVLGCPLTEEFKWRVPCYTLEGGNVVMIHGFKEYCAILFVKGSLLSDPKGILIQQTANVQGARQIRFKSLGEIEELAPIIKEYIWQAIEIEKSGAAVDYKKSTDFTIPEELLNKFDEMPELSTAFHGLTPGRQRAYILHFTEPKQAKTRVARVEKYITQILDGKGLND